jgi:hypothetical protein
MKFNLTFPSWVLAFLVFLAVSEPVLAQNFAGIEVLRDGPNAVFRVQFNSGIVLDKTSIKNFSKDMSISYRAQPDCRRFFCELDADGEVRASGGDGLPLLTFTDSSSSDFLQRKLTVSVNAAVKMSARESSVNKCVEIVMHGMGAYVKTDSQSNFKNYVVMLSSSTDPDVQIKSVPASVQAFEVFSDIRKKFGKTYYEYNLGYFDDEQQAQEATEKVRKRFPNAGPVPWRVRPNSQVDPAEYENWKKRIDYLRAKIQILEAN